MLQAEQKHPWHDIVRLDESWFCLSTDYERIWLAPHAPYSPDLAPSDFFRFGYLKSMLPGRHFETEEEL
jgi:hypothetical protein